MLTVLLLAPNENHHPLTALTSALRQAGYATGHTALGSRTDAQGSLYAAFEGRRPDVLLADLSAAADCLPLRHAARLLQAPWGEDVPLPVRLALLTPRHLSQPDWPAYLDDFLLPPYAPPEMLARLSLRSFPKPQVQTGDPFLVEDLVLELGSGCARDQNGQLPLTPREYELLRFLALHRGKFFARDRLLDLVWGVEFEGGERTVDIHIRRLRAKMPPLAAEILETRRGIGYGLRS